MDCQGGDGPPRPGRTGPRPAGKPITARSAALLVLADLRDPRQTARASIDALIARYDLPPRDLALTWELVMGLVRHRLTLIRLLGSVVERGWPRVQRPLQDILMLGAYQLVWLDGVPAFAAVNEAVEAAKAAGGLRAGRFVNASLRQLLRDIEHHRFRSTEADPTRAVPIDDQLSCQFRRAVLPDPAEYPVEHLAYATSHPVQLVGRWVKAFGMERTQAACRAGTMRPPTFIRPNRLRTDPAGLVDRLKREGIHAQATSCGRIAVAEQAAALIHSGAFADGWFQPQDPTSMRVVQEMHLSPGQVVLDLCAGFGTKTTQMAEAMNDTGTVLACDKDEGKLEALQANVRRLGLRIVRTVMAAELAPAVEATGELDWILIDAPCSNTGVLARRPEARYRVNRPTLAKLAALQQDLLALAAGLAGPRTRLMYSTCSLELAENEEVIQAFAVAHPRWRLAGTRRIWPAAGPDLTDWQDGGYWAVWAR